MRGDNVFIYQNIIIHYKYLHNNIHTFVEFLDQLIYAFFCPAPPRGFLSSPRPAPLEKAPPRTSLIQVQNLLLHLISQGWHFTAYFPIILWVPKLFIICADNCYPLLIFCWSINVINFKIEIVYFPNNSVQREHLFTLCFHHQSISCQHLDICDILRPPFDIGSCQRCQHLDIHSFQNAWKGNVKEK